MACSGEIRREGLAKLVEDGDFDVLNALPSGVVAKNGGSAGIEGGGELEGVWRTKFILGAELRDAVGDGETGGDPFQIGEEREQGEVAIDPLLV